MNYFFLLEQNYCESEKIKKYFLNRKCSANNKTRTSATKHDLIHVRLNILTFLQHSLHQNGILTT